MDGFLVVKGDPTGYRADGRKVSLVQLANDSRPFTWQFGLIES